MIAVLLVNVPLVIVYIIPLEVVLVFKHIKRGKVDSGYSHYTDNFINGNHKLNVMLALAIKELYLGMANV